MKKLLIIILALLFAVPSFSQQRKAFVSIQSGASIPLGAFGGKELPEGGFALTGVNISMEGAWYMWKWLGAGVNASVNLHPVDAGALGKAKLASNPFYTQLIIRSDPYKSFSLNAGLFFRFPLARNLSLTSKALGGLLYAETPYQLYKAEYYLVGKNWFEITPAGDYEATFLAGAGLTYNINEFIAFLVQADYTYNKADFSFIQSGGTVRTEYKAFSYLNLTGGILFQLGKISE
jgi:hypothetical protein